MSELMAIGPQASTMHDGAARCEKDSSRWISGTNQHLLEAQADHVRHPRHRFIDGFSSNFGHGPFFSTLHNSTSANRQCLAREFGGIVGGHSPKEAMLEFRTGRYAFCVARQFDMRPAAIGGREFPGGDQGAGRLRDCMGTHCHGEQFSRTLGT